MVAAASPPVLIMGVDPGSRHTGYGLIKSDQAGLKLVAQGRISPQPAWPLARRLAYIHHHLLDIAGGHKPSAVAVEDIFHAKNARSALILGHVRGVILLAATQVGADIFEYAPRLVKNSVAGYGQAEKSQVAHMVAELLACNEKLAPDAADALAVAICHAGQCRLSRLLPGRPKKAGGSWRSLSAEDLAGLNYDPASK